MSVVIAIENDGNCDGNVCVIRPKRIKAAGFLQFPRLEADFVIRFILHLIGPV